MGKSTPSPSGSTTESDVNNNINAEPEDDLSLRLVEWIELLNTLVLTRSFSTILRFIQMLQRYICPTMSAKIERIVSRFLTTTQVKALWT